MGTMDDRAPSGDEAMGIAWWNSLSEGARAKWAAKAGTGVVADAWAAFKADGSLQTSAGELPGTFSPLFAPASTTQEEREAIAAIQAAAQALLRAAELVDRAGYGQLVKEPLAEVQKSVCFALDTVHGRN